METGLREVEVHAAEGVAGLAWEHLDPGRPELLSAASTLARATGHLPGVRDISNHLMAIGRVP
ncbi:hypothetical protein [Pseudonocardia pini]|uniref:hypothetical protein n=1 Tax=Pseudonocardia pini TaxID=2758030 RepID=UPI0015F04E48|nr:hypothetical protein [Pseudonocardia pini]